MLLIIPIVPRTESGWALVVPLMIAGVGMGMLVSQLNNYALAPIDQDRISEAAGVNSASGSFGLSFGLAFAGGVMLAVLAFSFTNLSDASTVLPPDEKEQVATVLEDDAQVMSDAQLTEQIAGQPRDIQDEIIRINDEARDRALQAAMLVPVLAGLIGFANSFRMIRLPDIKPSADIEGVALG
jgi:hypothetical protein